MTVEEKINILLVDDSPSNLLALEAILQAPDRILIRAASGDDALRCLLDFEVAVILLDVYMPGIDGLQTAELIRGREKLREVPIIFLTADSTGYRHLSRGYSLGAVDYIVKPVEPEILRSKVAIFVELFKRRQEIKHQAELLHEKNLQLEESNLARLKMLIELGQTLASEHEPDQVLQKFCNAAREILSAEYAAAGMIDPDDAKSKYLVASHENEAAGTDSLASCIPQSVLRALLKNGRPLRSGDVDDILSNRAASIRSFLGTPILTSTRGLGWVYLINKADRDDFDEADERLIETMATQVAIAYENATLYSEAQMHANELQLEIAERKHAEEERAQLLIRERIARSDAERANRTKDEFLSTLSHELRTPLTAILGWSQLVRRSEFDVSVLERAVETIERNARSQAQLIDDLLDVSRIITGKLSIDLRPVDIWSVIESGLEAVRPAFEAKGIHVETVQDPSTCQVLGDTNRLQQIFWNLFNNAVKFTPAGGHVKIEVRRNARNVQVAVTDSGIGVDPQFLPYIFERFRQADGSTTRRHGGLGLGLAIVRHLVEMHNGTIEAHSEGKDRGTTFTINLPLNVDTDLAVLSPHTSSEPDVAIESECPRPLESLRILVVDDEVDSREVIAAMLTNYGSDVQCCESVAAAIQKLEEWDPDLLLSDIGMPGEDGYSLIKKVRTIESNRKRVTPAIAVSAYATSDDRLQALSAGYQMHLTKPIDQTTLLKTITAALGRKA